MHTFIPHLMAPLQLNGPRNDGRLEYFFPVLRKSYRSKAETKFILSLVFPRGQVIASSRSCNGCWVVSSRKPEINLIKDTNVY